MRRRAPKQPLVDVQALPDPTTVELDHPMPANPNKEAITRLNHKSVMARAMAAGAGRERAIDYLLTYNPDVSRATARNLYFEIHREWAEDYKAEAGFFRSSQVKRLQNDLATMRAERTAAKIPDGRERPTWNDIARHERELARITGTYAPVDVKVMDFDEEAKEALTQVLSGMTRDEMEVILTEGYEAEENRQDGYH